MVLFFKGIAFILKVISIEALITFNLTLMVLLAVFQNPLDGIYHLIAGNQYELRIHGLGGKSQQTWQTTTLLHSTSHPLP